MDLPEISILNFFNKILISCKELALEDGSCNTESLINQCKSFVLGGQRGEYDIILSHCKNCGLLQINEGNVYITSLGNKLLDANKEEYFEITEAQKQIICERIVFKGAWNQISRDLFSFFSVNQNTEKYEVSIIDTLIPEKYNKTIHLFKYLGILKEDDFIISVDNKYSELVYLLTADSKTISELELEKLLMENRKLGAKAENAVLDFERNRLLKLGKIAQADLVKRVSTNDVAAGYDIKSFDGITNDIFHNRFIEVKATQEDQIRFYWTYNEKRIAKIKKTQYWIYVMKNFKVNEPEKSVPIMIQDPEYNIPKIDFLLMEAHKFLIEEISDAKLTKYEIDDLTWYQIK